MKDILVVGKLKEGAFEKFMGFMQSDEGSRNLGTNRR